MSVSKSTTRTNRIENSNPFSKFFKNLAIISLSTLCVIGQVHAGVDGDSVPDAIDVDNDNDGILDSVEGRCTDPSTTLNSEGYGTEPEQLQNTEGFPLTFFDGQMILNVTLNGTAAWTPGGNGGVQIKNDGLEDYLYYQPRFMNNYFTSGNSVTYIFDFPFGPVANVQMNPGGLNFDDGTTVTAFNGATPVPIVSDNFTNLSAGMSVQTNNATDDTVASTNTTGGIDVLGNDYTLTIPDPVTRVVIETGKTDAATGNVTLGFSAFGWDCISLDTDLDGTPDYLDTDADGDMCVDANEAYAADGTDTNGDGTFGGVVGAGQVNGDGTVSAASYAAPATTGGETTFQEGITLSVDTDPTQQAFIVGNTADFSATLSSATVLNDPTVTTGTAINYQWQVSTDGGATFNDVTGGTNASGTTSSGSTITYTTPNLVVADATNQYRVVATNAANICGDTSASADFNAPFADLEIVKTDAQANYTPGAAFSYTITVDNNGPEAADGSLIADSIPTWAVSPSWACAASAGAVCPNASGSGDISETVATFPNGGQLVYTISGTYSADMADYP